MVAILCTFCVLLVRLESPLPNTNTSSGFVQQEPMTSCNISPTPINNYTQLMWHTDTNQNPPAKLPISLSSTLQKRTRHFQRTSLNPYLPKMLQSKKLTTEISSQTEFTMSWRLWTHNKTAKVIRKISIWYNADCWIIGVLANPTRTINKTRFDLHRQCNIFP